jgi:light-regulated signal transduction histidine kinase (bacteriophytochrome)
VTDVIDPDTPIDLTNCDREPIHILGAIQPIGFLVALSPDWVVERGSANLAAFLGVAPAAAIGRPLSDLLPPETIHLFRNRVAMLGGPDAVERIFGCALGEGLGRYDIGLHLSGGQIVIEGEPATDDHGDATNTVRSMIARLDRSEGLPAFWNEGARMVRALTGFDRVMVYRFAADDSGEVVAEACRAGIGSFAGLHYPASDIPVQARALYKRNLLRVIADVDAVPVAVVPQLDGEGRPLDLSLSILRSVSPIHIEYLRNMGVGASMSISIVVDDRLWGLFACHHYGGALAPSFAKRSVCELFAQMFAMRLESRERKATVDFERRARDIADQLLGAVASDETLLNNPDWLREVLTHAIPADGVGVWINGSHAVSGNVPPEEDFRAIVTALHKVSNGSVYTTDRIGALVPGAESFAHDAAGMLAIPISRAPRDYVVLFRSELIRSVRWGGDPHKPVEYGPNGPRLTPRESFAEWKETVEGRAQAFSSSELSVAETLRATLIEVVLRMADEAMAEREQANQRQELLIAELNHRVRNILGVIRGLIRQSKPHDDSIDGFVKLVDGRIHALARAHNQITDDHWGPAPIQALIDAEAAAFLADRPDRIVTRGEPVLLNPQAYSTMALVIHELVTNSAKYGSLSDSGTVEIDWHRAGDGSLLLTWTELGGPPVKAPTRKGFGSTIVNRSVPYDLGGTATIEYPPQGVIARFCIPSRHVTDAPDNRAPIIKFPRAAIGHPVAAPEQILASHHVLLVEDSLIIALDAEDVLGRLGATYVATAATVQGGLDAVRGGGVTLAMLDINLGDSTSFPIADRLSEAGIPFLFASGYGEEADLPPKHAGRTVLQKPYTLENVARALDRLLGDEAAG